MKLDIKNIGGKTVKEDTRYIVKDNKLLKNLVLSSTNLMPNKSDIVITSAVRTAVGSLGKSLKSVPGYELGTAVLNEAINRSK